MARFYATRFRIGWDFRSLPRPSRTEPTLLVRQRSCHIADSSCSQCLSPRMLPASLDSSTPCLNCECKPICTKSAVSIAIMSAKRSTRRSNESDTATPAPATSTSTPQAPAPPPHITFAALAATSQQQQTVSSSFVAKRPTPAPQSTPTTTTPSPVIPSPTNSQRFATLQPPQAPSSTSSTTAAAASSPSSPKPLLVVPRAIPKKASPGVTGSTSTVTLYGSLSVLAH